MRTLMLLLLAGCAVGTDGSMGSMGSMGEQGPPGPPGPQGPPGTGSYADGSRLKQRYLVGEDGARLPAGTWDTKLQAACSPALAADGALRCLPSDDLSYGPITFADPACSLRVFPASAPLPKFSRHVHPKGQVYQVFRLEKLEPQPVSVWIGEACRMEAAQTGATYLRATEMQPTELVAFRWE